MGAKQRPFLAAAIMPPVTPALFRIHRRQNAQAAMSSGPDCDGAGEGMLECQAGVNEGEFVQMIRPEVTDMAAPFWTFWRDRVYKAKLVIGEMDQMTSWEKWLCRIR